MSVVGFSTSPRDFPYLYLDNDECGTWSINGPQEAAERLPEAEFIHKGIEENHEDRVEYPPPSSVLADGWIRYSMPQRGYLSPFTS